MRVEQRRKRIYSMESVFIVSILLLFLLITSLLYNLSGPAWDVIVHYLNAKNYMSNIFLSKSFGGFNIFGWEIQQNTFYIEPLREAIPSLIFVPLILLSGNPIFLYICFLFLIFVLSVWYFGNLMKFNKVILYGVMLSPFFIYFSLLANGTEALSVSFLLIALGLLHKKSPLSGVFFALAGLSKYPNLVFLPMLLFLGGKKRILAGYCLFIFTTLPWLAFNYVFYGNPIYAYVSSIGLNVTTRVQTSIPAMPFLIGIAIPIVYLSYGLAHAKFRGIKNMLGSALRNDGFVRISTLFTFLAIIAYAVIATRTDFFGQIRYAYLVYLSAALFVFVVLQGQLERAPKLPRNVFALAILILALSLSTVFNSGTAGYLSYINVNSNGSVIKGAILRINGLGYPHCRVESNAWVYLIYLNESAYSPLFLNSTVASEYPIIAFRTVGISQAYLWNINQSRLAYSDANMSIYLPRNVTCVRG